jgi:predicted metal-dependent HD superfamily phosphohydrolase
MTTPQIKLVNAETGEEVIRDMNEVELAQWEADKAEAESKHDAEIAKQAAKDELLAKLGITADEAKLLIS